eukprot:XP_001696103.1 predicted protein [Chlamydomonas reinhardtii]
MCTKRNQTRAALFSGYGIDLATGSWACLGGAKAGAMPSALGFIIEETGPNSVEVFALSHGDGSRPSLVTLVEALPHTASHVRFRGLECMPQDALHALLGRCLHLAALALPARELPSSCPLGAAEQRAPAELVAARLSRLPGAWALQQLPCSLTELSLTHCGWIHPNSLVHLRGLTALTRLSLRGVRVPPPPAAEHPQRLGAAGLPGVQVSGLDASGEEASAAGAGWATGAGGSSGAGSGNWAQAAAALATAAPAIPANATWAAAGAGLTSHALVEEVEEATARPHGLVAGRRGSAGDDENDNSYPLSTPGCGQLPSRAHAPGAVLGARPATSHAASDRCSSDGEEGSSLGRPPSSAVTSSLHRDGDKDRGRDRGDPPEASAAASIMHSSYSPPSSSSPCSTSRAATTVLTRVSAGGEAMLSAALALARGGEHAVAKPGARSAGGGASVSDARRLESEDGGGGGGCSWCGSLAAPDEHEAHSEGHELDGHSVHGEEAQQEEAADGPAASCQSDGQEATASDGEEEVDVTQASAARPIVRPLQRGGANSTGGMPLLPRSAGSSAGLQAQGTPAHAPCVAPARVPDPSVSIPAGAGLGGTQSGALQRCLLDAGSCGDDSGTAAATNHLEQEEEQEADAAELGPAVDEEDALCRQLLDLQQQGGAKSAGADVPAPLPPLDFTPFAALTRLSLLRLADGCAVALSGCWQLQLRLRTLSVADCSGLGDVGLKALPKLRHLHQLSLRGLAHTHDGVFSTWTGPRLLGAAGVGGVGGGADGGGLDELRSLELGIGSSRRSSLCGALSDLGEEQQGQLRPARAVDAAASTELHLHHMPHLTPATVEQVLSRPRLAALVVDGCRQLTSDVCDLLAVGSPP